MRMNSSTFTVRLSSQPGDNAPRRRQCDDHCLGLATESDYDRQLVFRLDGGQTVTVTGSDNLVMEISRTVIKDNGPRCTLPMWILRMSR